MDLQKPAAGRAEDEKVGTVFVVKEDEEYCFIFERDSPGDLYSALFDCAEREDLEISNQEVLEMIEGIVLADLRGI